MNKLSKTESGISCIACAGIPERSARKLNAIVEHVEIAKVSLQRT